MTTAQERTEAAGEETRMTIPNNWGGLPSEESRGFDQAIEALIEVAKKSPDKVLNLIWIELDRCIGPLLDEAVAYGQELGTDRKPNLDDLNDEQFEARTGWSRSSRRPGSETGARDRKEGAAPTTLIEDLFLADDLEAADMPSLADWVRSHTHEQLDWMRTGLHEQLDWMRAGLLDPDDLP